MISRNLKEKLLQLIELFPIVSVTGPRQSGKTTLVRNTFSHLPYVSLENPDHMQFAQDDPRKFLANYPEGAVFDEVQRVPEIFSYLQGIVDEEQSKKYVLSGSQNFLLAEQISQSLAGRVGILKLLPFSMAELKDAELLDPSFEKVAYTGFYPRIFDQNIQPNDFYPNYVQTYVERDVRQLTQVSNLNTFSTFLKLCAGRAGQLLNLSELSNDVGISVNTVKSWINILESSYIVFRLYPHYKNFNKRLIKMPKLYFYDTGLLNYLLGIREYAQIQTHFAKGAIFENLIIAELFKQKYHSGKEPNLYFWRDNKGKEIDLLIEHDLQLLIPVEIKSGATKSMSFFEGLKYWNRLSGNEPENAYVVYGGDEDQLTGHGHLIGWKSFIDHSF
ncbi:ATP-binding protein [Fulvivirga sp. M361]|uniref:ATP-binding protein n=1 Tax=Fulvivirga sp. M361 TaxID=2594266 RepID=UPI00117B9ACF|nr:ATP-binding protein [Fulvivirga sp. M361]TRX60473.1 ATP-binding protein [Fulvivirga sp. M361]